MSFKKGLNGNNITYPITQDQINKLRFSKIVNPKVGNNHGVKIPDNFDIEASCEEVQLVRQYVKEFYH